LASEVVREEQRAFRIDDENAFVDEVDDGGELRRVLGGLALELARARDVVEYRHRAGEARIGVAQRYRVDQENGRAAVELERELGADDRLLLRERAADRMQRGRQVAAVGRARQMAIQQLADGATDVPRRAEQARGRRVREQP